MIHHVAAQPESATLRYTDRVHDHRHFGADTHNVLMHMSQLTRARSVTWSGQRTPSASKEIPPALMVFYAWTTVAICVAFCIHSSHWKRWYYKCKEQRLHPSIIKLTTVHIILWNKNSKNFKYTFCVFTSPRWPACVRNYLFFLPERITPFCILSNC